MISDLSHCSASSGYGQSRGPVKNGPQSEGAAGRGVFVCSVTQSLCPCCGRPIRLLIGRPRSSQAAGPAKRQEITLTPEAERLISGRRRVTLDDIFGTSSRTVAKSRIGSPWEDADL